MFIPRARARGPHGSPVVSDARDGCTLRAMVARSPSIATLALLFAACGGAPPPAPERPPAPAPEPPPPAPLPEHDLAGAPAFSVPGPCSPVDGPHVLRGQALTDALDALRAAPPDVVHHEAFVGSCEADRREVSDALYAAGRAQEAAGAVRLATTLYTQALYADPSSVAARLSLALLLAETGRATAAVTHLRELRHTQEGLDRLAPLARDRASIKLRERMDWFELMYPNSDLEGESAPLEPTGDPVAAPVALPPGDEVPGIERARVPWDQVRALLLATPPFAERHPDPEQLGMSSSPWVRSSSLPFPVVTGDRVRRIPGGISVWRPAPGAFYAIVGYRQREGEDRTRVGYALYEIGQGLRLLRDVVQDQLPCEGEDDDAAGMPDSWFLTPDRDELRELHVCGRQAVLIRIRHDGRGLRMHTGRVDVAPAPTLATDEDWVPEVTAAVEIETGADGLPLVGPFPTCAPQTGPGVLGGRAVRAHLETLRSGTTDGVPGEADLLRSCAVDARDVGRALTAAARARLAAGDEAGFRQLTRRAVTVAPNDPLPRFDQARAYARAADVDAALAHLFQLGSTGDAGAPAIVATVSEPDLAPARADARYWVFLDQQHGARGRYQLGVRAFTQSPTPLETRLTMGDGAERLARARGPWGRFNDLLSAAMTERRYRRPRPRRVDVGSLPERVRQGGFSRLTSPTWWTPAAGHTFLVIPYVHPEAGFEAVGIYRTTEAGLVYVGRDRTDTRDCADEALELTGFDDDGRELRLFTSCGEHEQYLCRFVLEGDQLREICSFPPLEREAIEWTRAEAVPVENGGDAG